LLQGVLVVTRVDFERPGPWRELWPHALGLMSHLEGATASPEWTFGGCTVLMLRHDHRFSKDIGRRIRVETSAEIIAKKMWHRGDQAKARDLFDLCAVATFEPEAIEPALPFMARHAAAFLERLERRAELAEAEFEQIEARSFKKSFWECLLLAQAILGPG
jgi:hypothetical protein